MKTKKKSGKTLRKSGKSQGKIREFDGIKKVGTLIKIINLSQIHSLELVTSFSFEALFSLHIF